ncbi:MAG: hypothetical protein U1D55_14020 [Phycisphaerae bacterium]
MAWRLNRGIGQPVNLTTNQAKEADFITAMFEARSAGLRGDALVECEGGSAE